jgi:hypothetical protein
VCQGDAMFLAGGEDVGGADRPAGLGNVTHAVLLGVVDVIAERDRAVGDETACRKVDSSVACQRPFVGPPMFNAIPACLCGVRTDLLAQTKR